jgi:hypothetical protein
LGEQAGAWWQVDWTVAQSINSVVLCDRPNGTDQWKSGTISFSDGSSVGHGNLDNGGAPLTVNFAMKTGITWMRITSTNGTGLNIGLCEVEGYSLTYQMYSQAQGHIGPLVVAFAQANARIKAVGTTQFGQAQIRVKQITPRFAQANASIKPRLGHAHALAYMKHIERDNWAQARAQIRQFNRVRVGQTQAWIDQDSAWKHGLALAYIARKQGYSNAQAKIWNRKPHAQAQAYIEQTLNAHGQAQTWIERTHVGHAQAAALMNIFGLAQAQARIYSFLTLKYAQAQALIPGVYRAHAQAQAHLAFQRLGNHAQANAKIRMRARGYAQAQGTLKGSMRAYGQSGALISRHQGFGQARAYVFAGIVFDNGQAIEERVNPRTQIRWAKTYTLRPVALGTNPVAADIPEINAGEVVVPWQVSGPDAVTIVARTPPDGFRTGYPAVSVSDWNYWVIYSDAGSLQTDEYRRINSFLFSTADIIEDRNEYEIVNVKAFMVSQTDTSERWPPTIDWYHTGQNKAYFGKTLTSIVNRPTLYLDSTAPPWDTRGWTWEELDNISITASAREGNFGEGAAFTYVLFIWLEVTIQSIAGSSAFLLQPHRDTHEKEFNPVPPTRVFHDEGNDLLSLDIRQVQSLEGLLGVGVGTALSSNAAITGDWTFTNNEIFSKIIVPKANLQRLRFRAINRPSNPEIGWVYYDIGNQQLWYYAEDGWKAFAFEGMYGYPMTPKGYAQAHSWIKSKPFAHAQTQARIIQKYPKHGQAQAWIRHVKGHGQAQGKILAPVTVFTYGQSGALINARFGRAQAQGLISNKMGFGQARALINSNHKIATGQALGTITVPTAMYVYFVPTAGQYNNGLITMYVYFVPTGGQAYNSLAAMYLYADVDSFIPTYFGFPTAQAAADIDSIYFLVTRVQVAQGQGYIVYPTGLAQAQARIKTTYAAHAQAQAKI